MRELPQKVPILGRKTRFDHLAQLSKVWQG